MARIVDIRLRHSLGWTFGCYLVSARIVDIRLRHSLGWTFGCYLVSAEELEKELSELPLEIVDPPRDTKHYVCPKYHPDLFPKRGSNRISQER